MIETELFCLSGADAPHQCSRACLDAKSGASTVVRRALRAFQCGQLSGDEECPVSAVTSSGSLDEGAGKRCLECGGTTEDFNCNVPASSQSTLSTELVLGYRSKMFCLMDLSTCVSQSWT